MQRDAQTRTSTGPRQRISRRDRDPLDATRPQAAPARYAERADTGARAHARRPHPDAVPASTRPQAYRCPRRQRDRAGDQAPAGRHADGPGMRAPLAADAGEGEYGTLAELASAERISSGAVSRRARATAPTASRRVQSARTNSPSAAAADSPPTTTVRAGQTGASARRAMTRRRAATVPADTVCPWWQ